MQNEITNKIGQRFQNVVPPLDDIKKYSFKAANKKKLIRKRKSSAITNSVIL